MLEFAENYYETIKIAYARTPVTYDNFEYTTRFRKRASRIEDFLDLVRILQTLNCNCGLFSFIRDLLCCRRAQAQTTRTPPARVLRLPCTSTWLTRDAPTRRRNATKGTFSLFSTTTATTDAV